MTTNSIGHTLYIAEALPATNNSTGFEALTWVKVNGVVSIGERGVSHETIDIPDLQTGWTRVVKGAGSGIETSIVVREIAADAGQEDVRNTAQGEEGQCSIKIVLGSGASQAPVTGDPVEYAQGIMHTYREREKTTSSYEGFSVVFRNNEPPVIATEPV